MPGLCDSHLRPAQEGAGRQDHTGAARPDAGEWDRDHRHRQALVGGEGTRDLRPARPEHLDRGPRGKERVPEEEALAATDAAEPQLEDPRCGVRFGDEGQKSLITGPLQIVTREAPGMGPGGCPALRTDEVSAFK